MLIRTEEELRRNLELMLITRARLGQIASTLPSHRAIEVYEFIADIDGYLTLQAPTTTAH